jgi:hypothetical protein
VPASAVTACAYCSVAECLGFESSLLPSCGQFGPPVCHGPPPEDKETRAAVQQMCSDLTADRCVTVAVIQRHCEVGAGVAVFLLTHQFISQCTHKCAFLLQGVLRVSCNLLGFGGGVEVRQTRTVICCQPSDYYMYKYIPFLLSNLSAPLQEMTNEITARRGILTS